MVKLSETTFYQKFYSVLAEMLRIAIYGLMFGLWVYSLYYDVENIPSGPSQSWFRKLKFLTIINLVLETGYFTLCFVRALVDTFNEKKGHGPHTQHPQFPSYYSYSRLHSFCDTLYVLALPLSFAVTLLFWGLYVIDRELVYPKVLDDVIPSWLNHVMHTAPVFFMTVDTILTCHKMPKRSTGIVWMVILVLFYEFCLVMWYLVEGIWAYPFFDVLDTTGKAVFFLGAIVFFLILYLIGDGLNSLIWGPASHPPSKTEPQGRYYSQINRKKMRKD